MRATACCSVSRKNDRAEEPISSSKSRPSFSVFIPPGIENNNFYSVLFYFKPYIKQHISRTPCSLSRTTCKICLLIPIHYASFVLREHLHCSYRRFGLYLLTMGQRNWSATHKPFISALIQVLRVITYIIRLLSHSECAHSVNVISPLGDRNLILSKIHWCATWGLATEP